MQRPLYFHARLIYFQKRCWFRFAAYVSSKPYHSRVVHIFWLLRLLITRKLIHIIVRPCNFSYWSGCFLFPLLHQELLQLPSFLTSSRCSFALSSIFLLIILASYSLLLGSEWQKDSALLDHVWLHLALKTFDFDLGNVPEEHRVRI